MQGLTPLQSCGLRLLLLVPGHSASVLPIKAAALCESITEESQKFRPLLSASIDRNMLWPCATDWKANCMSIELVWR